MEIKINLNEDRFSQLLTDELQKFTTDEVHQIIGEAMRKYLENGDNFKEMFIKTHEDRWGYKNDSYTPLVEQVIKKIDFSPIFLDIQNKILDYFKNDENIMRIAKQILGDTILKGLTKSLFNDDTFRSELTTEIRQNIFNNN